MFFTALKRAAPVPFHLIEEGEEEDNEGKSSTAIQFDNFCRINSFCRRDSKRTEH